MTDTEETISKSEIINRAHWNRKLIDELLGDPDVRLIRPNGKVYSARYSLIKVKEAELHPKIVARKEKIANDQKIKVERLEEVVSGIRYAIAQDINNMKINYDLCFNELIESLKAQMYLFNGIMGSIDSKYLVKYYKLAGSTQGVDLHMERQIALLIKEKHSLYAFEAGRYYEGHTNTAEYPFCQLVDRD